MSHLTPDQIPEKWGDIASAYGEAFETLTSQFADEGLKQLSPEAGESVLDVAAGTGAFSLAAAKQGADVLATDFAEGMVEHIRQRIEDESLDNIKTRVMVGIYRVIAADDLAVCRVG